MSVWTDPIIIPPITIVYMGLGFLINKIIDRKAGKHLSDLERLNYVGDKGVDTLVMHSKKVKGVVKTIMSDDDELPSETIPSVYNAIKAEDEMMKTFGHVLSEQQLEMDHLKHKLTEAGIDINNGETKENPIIE